MPNAAAMVGHSATALCKAGSADDNDLQVVQDLFQAFGSAVIVDEKLMNAVTALASSGLAYFFIIMEALTDAAVRVGMDRSTARQLTVQTTIGAAAMAYGGAPFSDLKDRITSPGGTTVAALQVMERAGIRGTIMDAVEAATRRGEEIAQQK
jgi:pyrroline-5-carboxylate reductase